MINQVVPGSFSLIKKINMSLILNIIREKGPISRAKLAKITNLTPATVTNITSELIKYNFILEAERGKSSGGRKPVMLRINSNSYYVVGVYIGSKGVDMMVSNLSADIIHSISIDIDSSIPSDIVLNDIAKKINDWITANKDKKVLGIGIGLHGLVNSSEGISVFAPNLGWKNVQVKSILEKKLNIPVFVDNDVRAMTLGESWFGVAQNVSNFVFIHWGYGIGGSIVINSQVYRGANEGAGEIGHTTIEVNGPKCSCGNYGCLQALISEQTIINEAKTRIKNGENSIINDMVSRELSRISPEIVFEAALNNDQMALSIVRKKSKYLGVAVANLINMFNPSLVIINGRIITLGDIIMKCIREEVNKRSLSHSKDLVKITFSKLGQQAVLKGTTALVLSEIFKNPERAYSLSK